MVARNKMLPRRRANSNKVAEKSKSVVASRETRRGFHVTDAMIAWAKVTGKRDAIDPAKLFSLPAYPPGVVPKGHGLAMDDFPSLGWAGQQQFIYGTTGDSAWVPYTELSILAQRPEYRRISEVIATEMTRKWVEFQSRSESKATGKQITKLNDAVERYRVRDAFRKIAELDGFFGRGHLYIDLGTTDDREELQTPIGNGTNPAKLKIAKGSLKRLAPIEPVWCYPAQYNSNDPLKPNWYRPESWFVMGKQLHGSRLLTFIGREVPDLLKPSYAFGGLSLTQMAIPYVNNWLKTRQSVNDLISAFSQMVLATNLSESLGADGDQLFKRATFFNLMRDNRGLMMLDKTDEDFKNVSAPLGTLDALQAQAQEHMAAVSGIPLVKLLGIQPAGLNASSEGEIRTFYDNIGAYQERLFRQHLTTVTDIIQLSEFGEIDEDITYRFMPLWSLDEKGEAEVRYIRAQTDQVYVDAGILNPIEPRERIAHDPGSGYAEIDVDDVPEPIEPEPGNIKERVDVEETGQKEAA